MNDPRPMRDMELLAEAIAIVEDDAAEIEISYDRMFGWHVAIDGWICATGGPATFGLALSSALQRYKRRTRR